MKFSFFKALAAALFAGATKPPSPADLAQAHAGLKRKPELQRLAKQHGDARRLAAHRRSCLQAYEAKRQLVDAGKGHNTLAGIPAAAS